MPALTSTTYNRNFETVYWENPNRLRYWYFDQTAQKWVDVGYVGDATAIVAGYPAFIQSSFDSPEPGDLEVVFRGPDGTLQHWTGSVGAKIDWTRKPPVCGQHPAERAGAGAGAGPSRHAGALLRRGF